MCEKGPPVSFGMVRISSLGVAVLLMAGCGGPSGGGSGSGGSGGNGGNGGGSNSTTVTFAIAGSPTAVATRVGSGSFSAATLSNGSLTLSLPSGTANFALAYVCPPVTVTSYQLTTQSIVEASTVDGASYSVSCGSASSAGTTGTLTGAVDASAISGASFLSLVAQNSTSSTGDSLGVSSGNFSLLAPEGTDRVEVVAYNQALNNTVEYLSMVAAKNFTGVSVPGALNGGNTVVFGAADQATLQPITYNSVPSGFGAPTTLVDYSTGSGGFLVANAVTSAYPAVPAAAMESGDYYYFHSYAPGPSVGEVIVNTTSTSSGPLSVTFPPAWTYAGPAAAKWLSFDTAYTGFSGTTGVCDEVDMQWSISPTNHAVRYEVSQIATGNYLNGSTTVAITDLSGLPGFLAAPVSGSIVSWWADLSQGASSCLLPTPLNSTTKVVSNFGFNYAP